MPGKEDTMSIQFQKEHFVQSLAESARQVEGAVEYGRSLAPQVDRIYFISCGAPNRIMQGLQYWLEHFSNSLEVRRYFPAEFMQMAPPRLDERTLVVMASKSGTTPETVQLARYLADRPCLKVAVTQTADLPLAKAIKHTFLLGPTEEAYFGCFMVLQALIGGLMAAKDGWPYESDLIASLEHLPEALADAAIEQDDRGRQIAHAIKDDKVIYHLASGPMYTAAYVLGVCILAESQWLHSIPVEAAEFFHGPFESFDDSTPALLYLGEDPSRPQMERVVDFCRRFVGRAEVYDARDFAMQGIAHSMRAMLAPYIVGFAAERIAVHLAELNDQPLTTRRYMWKLEY
jgi:fructoselysine 6-phosphate deglycase